MAPVAVVPGLRHCQSELSCSGPKAHLSSFRKRFDRALYLSTVAVLDLRRIYPPSLQNDGISRSQLSLDLKASALEAAEMMLQRDSPLDERMEFQWIYGKECPTSMPYRSIASSEVNGDDSNVD